MALNFVVPRLIITKLIIYAPLILSFIFNKNMKTIENAFENRKRRRAVLARPRVTSSIFCFSYLLCLLKLRSMNVKAKNSQTSDSCYHGTWKKLHIHPLQTAVVSLRLQHCN